MADLNTLLRTALLGSVALIAGAFLFTWVAEVALPAVERRWRPGRADHSRKLLWAFAVALFLGYALLVCHGVSRRLVAELVSAQVVFMLLWGTVVGLVGLTHQQRGGAPLLLKAKFDEERVARRRRRLNLSIAVYMVISVVVIAYSLTPQLAARTGLLVRLLQVITATVSSLPAIMVLLLVLLLFSVIGASYLDRRSGTHLLDDLFSLMQPVSGMPITTMGALFDAAGMAQTDELLRLLFQIEQEDCALSVAAANSEIDLYSSLPEELRAFLDRLAEANPAAAERYMGYARERANRIAERLERVEMEKAQKRARQWRLAFPPKPIPEPA